MCTHVNVPSENGQCVAHGVPNCASTDYPDACSETGCGEVTITVVCIGSPTIDQTVPDCCDAG